jgi:hypothetical protein
MGFFHVFRCHPLCLDPLPHRRSRFFKKVVDHVAAVQHRLLPFPLVHLRHRSSVPSVTPVPAARDTSARRRKRQHRIESIQCLNRRLLIHTEHGVLGGLQIQTNDGGCLGLLWRNRGTTCCTDNLCRSVRPSIGDMTARRGYHAATLLKDGRVSITGGLNVTAKGSTAGKIKRVSSKLDSSA